MAAKEEGFITIVSGLPRSGTSLLMQMLEAGGMPILTDHQRQPDDDNPRGYFEFEPVKQLHTQKDWLLQARGKAVKMVYSLLYELPADYSYRVLVMQRDITEVLASQRVMLERHGRDPGPLDDARMAHVFTRELHRALAWMQNQAHFQTMVVPYRDTVNDPAGMACRLNAFLGSRLNAQAMVQVVDPSLHRQRL